MRNGVTLTNRHRGQFEAIEDPQYNSYAHQSLYPTVPIFKKIEEFWSKHQACFWSINENDPSVDRDKFCLAPSDFQEILLKMVGCIMIGDSIVLDRIAGNIMSKITSITLKAMMSDQEAREYTHKFMYSRMLDVSDRSDYYRSEAFKKQYMHRFESIAQQYVTDDIRIQFYFIMLCENILFAPMFQTICYLATLGYAPKLCDSNLLVMRDEYIHYQNARTIMASFKNKIDIKLANDILDQFHEEIKKLCSEIVGTYDDSIFNLNSVLLHLGHVIHSFRIENGLYANSQIFLLNHDRYATSPAAFYMELPKCELRNNLMESSSTIYMVNGNTEPINMNFKL